MPHKNNSSCQDCKAIFDRYPNFHKKLRAWFEDFQKRCPEAHISCAGRGKIEQEASYIKRVSNARWRQSAHNYNAAIDIFEMGGEERGNIYERKWFEDHVKPEVPDWLEWYGAPGSKYKEFPHVQVRGWKLLAANGVISLVEDVD